MYSVTFRHLNGIRYTTTLSGTEAEIRETLNRERFELISLEKLS